MEELLQLTKHSFFYFFFQKTVTSHKFIIDAIVANVELVFKAVGEKLNITVRNPPPLRLPAYAICWQRRRQNRGTLLSVGPVLPATVAQHSWSSFLPLKQGPELFQSQTIALSAPDCWDFVEIFTQGLIRQVFLCCD